MCETIRLVESENKAIYSAKVIVICAIAAIALIVFASIAGAAEVKGLGANPSEFQIIKETISRQLVGSEATLSEVTPPTFSHSQIERINQARKQLASLEGNSYENSY